MSGRTKKSHDPPIEDDVNVSLEELYNGYTKKLKISRQVMSPDGTSSIQEKALQVNVKPGWKAGTKVTFPEEGDQYPGRIPADVVFIIKERQHETYKRKGNDLIYTANISLWTALRGGHVIVLMLSGKNIQLPSYSKLNSLNPK